MVMFEGKKNRLTEEAVIGLNLLPILAILESFTIEFCFFGFAAFRATLRFVLKSFLSVKFLFAIGEHEFFVAVFADNGFVGHFGISCVYLGIEHSWAFPKNTRNRHLGMLNHFFFTMFKYSNFCQYIFSHTSLLLLFFLLNPVKG
jgi:hypothetical protein